VEDLDLVVADGVVVGLGGVEVVEELADVLQEEHGPPEDEVFRDEVHGSDLAAKCVLLLDEVGKHKSKK